MARESLARTLYSGEKIGELRILENGDQITSNTQSLKVAVK